MIKSAVISGCGAYRYELRRIWNDDEPPFVIGMLNPSTADHTIDDPTITRCINRAKALDYGSLVVWNLGAGRATDHNIWKRMADPIGPDNDRTILSLLTECRRRDGVAVVGWGGMGGFMHRDRTVAAIAASLGLKLHCLGTTAGGFPRHPLYVPGVTGLVPWRLP